MECDEKDAISGLKSETVTSSTIESLDLRSLITHREHVQARESVGAVYKSFENHRHEYVGVVEGEVLIGLCAKGQIGFLLGSRYGFSIYSQRPIRQHLMPAHLAVRVGTPILKVLESVLTRTGQEFYDDVALIDGRCRFLGIIPVQALVMIQSRLVGDKMREIEQQSRLMQEKNKDLFRSLAELRQSQGRYGILFENNALGVALLNRLGEVETMNRRLKGLLEIRGEEPGVRLVDYVVQAERQAFGELLQREGDGEAGQGNRHVEFNLHLEGKGNRLFRFFVSRISETGQICVCMDDISEQRVLERQMAQREKSALMESLVGGIAHEINNRLSPIIGYSELMLMRLAEGANPAELRTYCETVRDNGLESGKIIRQLLQLSKPVSRELSVCDLTAIASEAITLLKFRLKEMNIQPVLHYPAQAPRVVADPSQIKQVVVNLLLNALDAMEKSADRRLEVTVATEGPNAFISVADSGQGIRPEHLNRIFDPFFTTKGPQRGTGLGLSVCYSIVKQHGGEIIVRSEFGGGSNFRVVLPLANPAARAATRTSPTANHLTATDQKSRVLVVDDEQYITGFVQEALRMKMGCSVEWAFNGHQAIQRLEACPFSLIISDIRMPNMNGLELFGWVRANRPELAAKFFFITGDAGGSDINEEVEKLGVPVLRKPFTFQALLEQCHALLHP